MGCTKSIPVLNIHQEPKHEKYLKQGKSCDTFWGIGIENETYLQFNKLSNVQAYFLKNNYSRERYSVAYFNDYRSGFIGDCLKRLDSKKTYDIPIYLNAHSFTNTDSKNNPRKKYTKLCEPNPNFKGTSLHEDLINLEPYFSKEFNNKFTFDGDSIEFTTLNFYKNNVKSCVEELIEYKKEFLEKVNDIFKKNNIFLTYGSVIFPEINHGFVKFMTNIYNITICNNSTYHINITLPTELDRDGKIRYRKKFIEEHMNAARGVQWIEPFLVALYGSPDIFSVLSEKFHKGSARLSFCRYVGLCNYNTEEKETILGKKLNDLDSSKVKWYNALTQGSPYIPLDTIGYDINFNKFENHGLEFRFFDWFPECYLEDIMNILVLVMDFSIRHKFKNPIRDDVWNEVCKGCVQQGNEYKLTKGIENHFIENFIPLESGTIEYNENIEVFFQSIVDMLYKHRSDISEKLSPNMKAPKIFNYNRNVWKKYKDSLKV